MFARFIYWLLSWLPIEKQEIGRNLDIYLTRWRLWGGKTDGRCRVFLHHFHRGDEDEVPHNHPWAYWSLILWGGYFEATPCRLGREILIWFGPLSFLSRAASWAHRVVLPPGRKCWTLVWTGKKTQSWGFLCKQGWRHWKEHERATQLTGTGCGEIDE
jgi:hypothetical protein